MRSTIPKKTVYRLSVYLRCLDQLREAAVPMVSSQALAQAAGVKPTQLRKDLAFFGHFGTRGLGYDVATLRDKIRDVLGREELRPVVLVGVGNLGAALMNYKSFEKEGFEVVAGFDLDTSRRSKLRQPVLGMEELKPFIRSQRIKMAILTVPAGVAQAAADGLIAAGITAILNFAPVVLQAPTQVVVSNVNLAIELENLSYFRSLAEG